MLNHFLVINDLEFEKTIANIRLNILATLNKLDPNKYSGSFLTLEKIYPNALINDDSKNKLSQPLKIDDYNIWGKNLYLTKNCPKAPSFDLVIENRKQGEVNHRINWLFAFLNIY